MKIIGVIAEFNPFHNGHKYFIDKIRNELDPDLIIAIITGNISMRGDISPIDKYNKVKICLNNNIDIVIEYPTVLSLNNSDLFTYNAVSILNRFKIDTLVFGSESNNIEYLNNLSDRINKINKEDLNIFLKQGYSYAKAISLCLNENINSNDLLGIGYITAIRKINSEIKPFLIKRINNNYNDINYNESNIQSATSIRNNEGNIKDYVVKETYDFYSKNGFNNIINYYDLIRVKVLTTDLKNIHLIKEGIDNRIKKYIHLDYYDLLNTLTSKRYTRSYINRVLISVLFSICKNEYTINNLDYIRILGLNNKAFHYIKNLRNNGILENLVDKTKDGISKYLDFEILISKVLSIKYNIDYKNEYKFPIIKK